MGLYIKLLMLIRHNRMVLPNVRIGIFLISLEPFYSLYTYLKPFGGMLLLIVCFLWITCHRLCRIINLHILCYFLIFLSFVFLEFGCICFAHVLNPDQDKLSPRAFKCIFLGYSKTQKRYKCYHHSTLQVFISDYVTFFRILPSFLPKGKFLMLIYSPRL